MNERRAARSGIRRRRSSSVPRRSPARGVLTLAGLAIAGLIAVALVSIVRIEGYRFYVVHTGSMEPSYLPGDLVVDGRTSGPVHRGEVITFRHSDTATDVVTHRVAEVTATGLIHTKGDANRTPDAWDIRPDQVRGRAEHRIPGLGYLIVFLRQPAGVASLATGVLAIVLLWGLFFPPEPPLTARRPRPGPRRPAPA